MAVALIEHSGLLFELGRKRTTLLCHQTPLRGKHSRPKWVSGTSRPLQIDPRSREQAHAMRGGQCNTQPSHVLEALHLPALETCEDICVVALGAGN